MLHVQITMSAGDRGKRWCFTINMATPESHEDERECWGLTLSDGPQGDWWLYRDKIEYLHFQEECGENGTHHLQGFVIFKQRVYFSWLHGKFHTRAHWELAKGTNQQADNYTKKEETRVEGGMHLTLGKLPERAEAPKGKERLAEAAEEIKLIKQGYKRPTEVGDYSLLQPGFVSAYKLLTADVLGPYRPTLRILTLIGRSGVGKSWAIQQELPNHGRAIYGNNGVWFQNPTSDVMIFEEFCGQIPLQRMLQLLDPYALALEVKGGMYPALYTKVVITSNTPPNQWYKGDEAGVPGKRTDALKALWDRLGYSGGVYIPVRDTGTYVEDPANLDIGATRQFFHDAVKNWRLACENLEEAADRAAATDSEDFFLDEPSPTDKLDD